MWFNRRCTTRHKFFNCIDYTKLLNKIVIGLIVIAIIVSIVLTVTNTGDLSNTQGEQTGQMHGTVSTIHASPILGNPTAPVTIIEFGDYQCHQCYNWFHSTKPQITRDYIDTGKANLIFVDLAFLGRDSPTAAQATYCAGEQGRYWEYHDILYISQEPKIDNGWASSERLKAFAFSMNLDTDMFNSCLDSKKYLKDVRYNSQQAKKHGISGTPGFIIVGPNSQEQISGAQPFQVFKQIVDDMI